MDTSKYILKVNITKVFPDHTVIRNYVHHVL